MASTHAGYEVVRRAHARLVALPNRQRAGTTLDSGCHRAVLMNLSEFTIVVGLTFWLDILAGAERVEMNQETEKKQHHIMVCRGINCRRNGSRELMEQLQQLLSQDETFQIKRYLCFGACDVAPNIVVVPDRLWYSFVAAEYMEDIAATIRKGEDLAGLANHVRPAVRNAVFAMLEAKRDQL